MQQEHETTEPNEPYVRYLTLSSSQSNSSGNSVIGVNVRGHLLNGGFAATLSQTTVITAAQIDTSDSVIPILHPKTIELFDSFFMSISLPQNL